MTDDAAFIRTVADSPDDDTPRLVYADWLEETGDPLKAARAEFIRLQIEFERLPPDDPARSGLLDRLNALRWSHALNWWRALPRVERVAWDWFTRGFVERVTADAEAFVRRAATLFAAAPIRRARLTFPRPNLAALRLLADLPEACRLQALELGPQQIVYGPAWAGIAEDEAQTLADSEYLKGLGSLVLTGGLDADRRAQRVLEKRFGTAFQRRR